jgi:oligoribonuclease (3'-5' exoribonuclease)
MPDSNLVLWLDLETDGTPEQSIIEVGLVLTDQTPEFNEIARMSLVLSPPWSTIIDPRAGTCGLIGMQEVVREMHLASGLWDQVMQSHISRFSAEARIVAWLDEHGATSEPIPAAGSGVAHFDFRRLEDQMPDLRTRLTYYALDIGAVRRFVHEVKGLPWYDDGTAKPHRALPDAELHLNEARWFMRNLWLAELTDEQLVRLVRLGTDKARDMMERYSDGLTDDEMVENAIGTVMIDAMVGARDPGYIDRWEAAATEPTGPAS